MRLTSPTVASEEASRPVSGAHRASLRVGLVGAFGGGNLGNDGSMEAIVTALRQLRPDASITCLGYGPVVRAQPPDAPLTLRMQSSWSVPPAVPPLPGAAGKLLAKAADLARMLRLARRFDVLLVPGMGVLEERIGGGAGGFPLALFSMALAARVARTPMGFVSVGADEMSGRAGKWLMTSAARMSRFRSYRDDYSRTSMQRNGLDTDSDAVFPDLAFALPTPCSTDDAQSQGEDRPWAGVGVMTYFGGHDDPERGAQTYARYVSAMTVFVSWLLDRGYRVRLLTGDAADDAAVADVKASVMAARPGTRNEELVGAPSDSLHELMHQMADVRLVVATRFHNVVCALMLCRPTISIGYAPKNAALMADVGLAPYCQDIDALDVDRLAAQVGQLEKEAEGHTPRLRSKAEEYRRLLQEQYSILDAVLLAPAMERP